MADRKGQIKPMGKSQDSNEFAGSMLKMMAAGLVGGVMLISGAKALGDVLFPEDSEASVKSESNDNKEK